MLHRNSGPNGPRASALWPYVGRLRAASVGHKVHTTFQPIDIARDRCKGCGLCVEVCPQHVLVLNKSVVNVLGYHPVELTNAADCTSCALCARICPEASFNVYAKPKAART